VANLNWLPVDPMRCPISPSFDRTRTLATTQSVIDREGTVAVVRSPGSTNRMSSKASTIAQAVGLSNHFAHCATSGVGPHGVGQSRRYWGPPKPTKARSCHKPLTFGRLDPEANWDDAIRLWTRVQKPRPIVRSEVPTEASAWFTPRWRLPPFQKWRFRGIGGGFLIFEIFS
jgi:hypothetical protein